MTQQYLGEKRPSDDEIRKKIKEIRADDEWPYDARNLATSLLYWVLGEENNEEWL